MRSTSKSRIRRLATGRLISVTGGAAAFTALNFTVWERTHSPGMQALSLLLTFGVAGILGPFAGVLGDRYDRRWVMVWSEAVGAVLFAGDGDRGRPGHDRLLIGLAFGAAIAEQPFFSVLARRDPEPDRRPRGPELGEQPGHDRRPRRDRDRSGARRRPVRGDRTERGVRAERGLVRDLAAPDPDRPRRLPGRPVHGRARRARRGSRRGSGSCGATGRCGGCRRRGSSSCSA